MRSEAKAGVFAFWACLAAAGLLMLSAAEAQTRPHLTASQRTAFSRVTNELVAPCCWRESIAVHRSPEALQMLVEVEQLVANGSTEAEIKAIYVERYGERILIDPEGSIGKWLYIVPTTVFGCLLILAFRRLRALLNAKDAPVEVFRPDLHELVRRETQMD